MWLSAADALLFSTSPTTAALGVAAGVAESTALPPRCNLTLLVIELTDIVTAEQITAWLTYDEDGAEGITPQRTTGALQVITPSVDDATKGFASFALGGVPFLGSNCWVHVVLDAGTAAGRVKLYSERIP